MIMTMRIPKPNDTQPRSGDAVNPHLPTSNNMRNTLETAIKPLVQT